MSRVKPPSSSGIISFETVSDSSSIDDLTELKSVTSPGKPDRAGSEMVRRDESPVFTPPGHARYRSRPPWSSDFR